MENQRVYYFCPVFSFTVPSTRVEADPFLPLTIGVKGHTQTACKCTQSTPHLQILTLTWMAAKVTALRNSFCPTYLSLVSRLCLILHVGSLFASLAAGFVFLFFHF